MGGGVNGGCEAVERVGEKEISLGIKKWRMKERKMKDGREKNDSGGISR